MTKPTVQIQTKRELMKLWINGFRLNMIERNGDVYVIQWDIFIG